MAAAVVDAKTAGHAGDAEGLASLLMASDCDSPPSWGIAPAGAVSNERSKAPTDRDWKRWIDSAQLRPRDTARSDYSTFTLNAFVGGEPHAHVLSTHQQLAAIRAIARSQCRGRAGFRRVPGDRRAPWTARASLQGRIYGVSPGTLRKPARPRPSANAARTATAAPTKGESGPARAPSRSPRRPAPAAATPGSPGPTTA